MITFSARRQYRLLEMVPGLMVWATLALALLACWSWPVFMIGFALVFDIYWFLRIVYLMVFVIAAYRRYTAALKVNWLAHAQQDPRVAPIWHLIMIPTVAEPESVLRPTLQAIRKAAYNPQQTLIVLATEARSPLQGQGFYERIVADFRSEFADLLLTVHPTNTPGEVTGKGANIAMAGKRVKTWIDDHHLPYDQIIVTTIDADSILHEQYLANVAIQYVSQARPTRASYQPIPLFHNNIWEALPFMRVVSYSTTFWLMGDTQRPDRLFTFSSHSMSFQTLVDVDFWQNDVVSEDSRIFLQCLIQYDGDYQVVPLYIPISLDTVQAPTWWQSIRNQYKQIRRWAYGAENFPFMAWNFLSNRAMPWRTKTRYLFYQIEGMYTWAVSPILLLILGWLPFHTRPDVIRNSILANNAPEILRWIMTAAFIGAILSAILSNLMLPKRPSSAAWYQWPLMSVQWLLLPVTMIIFGSIPAIEAQSRLMLGKYLGFWVTDKHRQEPSTVPTKA